MTRKQFSIGDIILRVIAAAMLVFATYNPSGYSYFHWLRETTVDRSFGDIGPWIALAGIILVIGWAIYIRATVRSLGAFGLLLAFGFCGILLWLVIKVGIVPTETVEPVVYSILVLLAFILGVGLSWSHVRRRLTGQLDVDDVEPG